MGRPRTRDRDLPPRLYRRGKSFYYVDAAGKWHALGSDRERALRSWVDLECLMPAATVGQVVRRYLADCTAHNAPSTRRQYALYCDAIEAKFAGVQADDLTRFALARWRDGGEVGPVWFNGCLALLRVAYRKAGEWGWTTKNEAAQVDANPTLPRARLLDPDEFRAIRAQAPMWLQLAMDLSYLTTLRESDVLALRWDAVKDRLYVDQIKPRRGGRPGSGVRQAFEISAPLRAVLEAARRRAIVGLHVVATDKGRAITRRRLQESFKAACKAAGVADARFHDIRGMAATAALDAGLDYQAMLGHSTRAMSDRYIKKFRTIDAPTLKKRL